MDDFQWQRSLTIVSREEKENELFTSCRGGHEKRVDFLLSHGVCVDVTDACGRTALMWASMCSHEHVVALTLRYGANVNICDKSGRTALMYSCVVGNREIIRTLLENGANVDKCDECILFAATSGPKNVVKMLCDIMCTGTLANACAKDGKTALMLACCRGHKGVVQLLIKRGARINKRDVDGRTAMMYACMVGEKSVVDLLLRRRNNFLNARDKHGKTALVFACEQGYEDIVELIVNHSSVDVNCAATSGLSALMVSCTKGFEGIVSYLLNHGAQLDATDKCGKTALMLACQYGCENIVRVLLDHGALLNMSNRWGQTALMYACQYGSTAIVRSLVDHGAFVSDKDQEKRSTLHYACGSRYDNVELVQILIENGVALKAVDRFGWTALKSACDKGHIRLVSLLVDERSRDVETLFFEVVYSGHDEIVKFFIENVFDIFSGDKDTFFLSIACRFGHIKIVKMLLEYGADTNKGLPRSPLWWACELGSIQIAELLVQHGAYVDAADIENCETMVSCRYGHAEVVELLIKNGADVNARSFDGSALMKACNETGNVKILELLIGAGADVNLRCKIGRSAFLIACNETGNVNILEILIRAGADSNERCCHGCTALMWACLNYKARHTKVVEFLLELGVDMNTRDKNGSTALMLACSAGSAQVVKTLLEQPLNVAAVDKTCFPFSFLILQCTGGNSFQRSDEKLKLNLRNNFGYTALMVACDNKSGRSEEMGYERIVELLLQHGALINIQSTDMGRSALMLAAWRGHVKCLNKLLLAGANVCLLDKTEKTVLSYAMMNPNVDCLRLLLTQGEVVKDAKLIQVHKKSVDTTTLTVKDSLPSLRVMMEAGLFEWRWCTMDLFKPVCLVALQCGVCPGKIKCGKKESYKYALPKGKFSPIVLAFLLNDTELIRLLINRLYFLPEDYEMLLTDSRIRDRITDKEQLDDVTLQPMTLETWCFLVVSKCISVAGPPALRPKRVDVLRIPNRLKMRLNFESFTL